MSASLQNNYDEEVDITAFNTTFVWKIKDFSVVLNEMRVGERKESPIFYMRTNRELKFNLSMCQKVRKDSEEYMGIYLYSYNDPAIKVEYKFVLLDSEKKENYEFKGENIFNQNNCGWGCPEFVRINELLRKKNELIVKDVLTILCEIKIDMTAACNKQPSDIKFSFDDGSKYHAHKNILTASSTVFANMFKRSANVDDIKIEGVDHLAFDAILQFSYLKKIIIGKSTMKDFLTAVDKYAIKELTCESELCKSITIDNAFAYLNIAHIRNFNNLKAKTIDFIRSNRNELIKGNRFIQNLLELPKDLTTEVFELLLPEGDQLSNLNRLLHLGPYVLKAPQKGTQYYFFNINNIYKKCK